jgi:hypothetical protein
MYNSKKQNVYWNLNSNFWRKYFINSFEWKKFAYIGVLPAFSFWFGVSYLFSTKTKQLSLPVIVVQNKEEKKIDIEELKNSLARSNFTISIQIQVIMVLTIHENNTKSILSDFKHLNEKQLFDSINLMPTIRNDKNKKKLSNNQFQNSHKNVSQCYTG